MKLMKNNKKMSKGITLIALVVTIIVLLLLAGISIQMLTGNNGILNRADDAITNTTHKSLYEAIQLEYIAFYTEKQTGKTTKEFIEYFLEKNIIESEYQEGTEKYQIKEENLIGTAKYGKGNAKIDGLVDVYMLEKQTTSTGNVENIKVASTTPIRIATTSNSINYIVKYYGKSNNDEVILGNIVDGSKHLKSIEERLKDYFNSEEGLSFEDNNDLGIKGSDIIDLGVGGSNYSFLGYKNIIYKVYFILADNPEEEVGEVTSVEKINNTDLTTLGEQINTFENMYYLKENGKDIDLNRLFSGNAYKVDRGDRGAIYYNTSGEVLPIIHAIEKHSLGFLYTNEDGTLNYDKPFTDGYYSADTNKYYDTMGNLVSVSIPDY